MSRRWAQLKTENGSFTKLSRKAAFGLVAAGDFEIMRLQPLTISLVQNKEFQEEQRYASGRKIPGVTRPPFNGKCSHGSGIRCRPPRSVVNMAYVRTAILQRDNLQWWIDTWDENSKQEKQEDKKHHRRARRRRKK